MKAPPKQTKNHSLQLRVPATFKQNLQRYAQFLDATPSYVVVEALNRIFEKDRDFKTWLEQHPHAAHDLQTNEDSATETIRKA